MAQPIASDRYILAPDTLSDAPEKLPAFNPHPIAAASVPAPMSTPTTIDGGTFGSGPDTLVMTLAEDAFQGDAQANIAIDGNMLNAEPITVTALKNAGQSETFTFKGTFGSGAHDLAVSFLNDAYGGTPTADRNLYVNGASYDGISTRPATAALDTTGTARFTIPPAGDPEAVPTTTDGGTFGSGPNTSAVTAPGQSVASNFNDTLNTNGQADTRFVFTAGFGQDVVQNFVAAGQGHDVLDLPQSDFTSIADVLRNTNNAAGGAVIHDPTTQDTIKVSGVSKTALAQHKNDFMFHA